MKSLFLKRKRPSVFPRFSLQQAGLTVTHTQYANEPKKKKKKTHSGAEMCSSAPAPQKAGLVVDSGSVDISRLSGVKADESHLA